MKYILALLLFAQIKADCQPSKVSNVQITCKYKLSYKADSTSSTISSEIFVLSLANGSSVFRSSAAIAADSLAKVYDSKPFNAENAQQMLGVFSKMPKSKFNYYIYKEASSNKILYYEKLGNKLYSY